MSGVLVFVLVGVVTGLIAAFSVRPWLRAVSYAVLVAALILLWHFSLGLPRDEYASVPAGTVLTYYADEPRAIYIWLLADGARDPLSMRLPWSEQVASNLAQASRAGQSMHASVRVRNRPGLMGLPTKPQFYVTAVRPLPPKSYQR